LLAPVAGGALIDAFRWGRWFVIPAGLLVFLATLYHYVHGWEYRWRQELPGALLATAGMVGAGAAYAAYLASGPELGLGPFFGAVVGGLLSTLGLLYGFAALMLLGGAYNAWLAHGEQIDPGAR
jgi:membrane protein